MRQELRRALHDQLLAMADDEMVLAHRNSEWCGHAPILEEDIAFANIALDELGHAIVWYELASALLGENQDSSPDELVYWRETTEYRNVQLVEQPNGDWASSMLRQYLFDAAESVRLERLVGSKYLPLAQAASKIQMEEFYHLRHTSAWVERLGLGTEESNTRMQRALNEIWPLAQQVFEPLAQELLLVEAGCIPAAEEIKSAWEDLVRPHLLAADLIVPEGLQRPTPGRDQHSEHLRDLLSELQHVARGYPNAKW